MPPLLSVGTSESASTHIDLYRGAVLCCQPQPQNDLKPTQPNPGEEPKQQRGSVMPEAGNANEVKKERKKELTYF